MIVRVDVLLMSARQACVNTPPLAQLTHTVMLIINARTGLAGQRAVRNAKDNASIKLVCLLCASLTNNAPRNTSA